MNCAASASCFTAFPDRHASDVFQTASILAHTGVEVTLCAVDFTWSALGVEQRNQASVFSEVGGRFAEGTPETTPALNANRTIAFTEDVSGHPALRPALSVRCNTCGGRQGIV